MVQSQGVIWVIGGSYSGGRKLRRSMGPAAAWPCQLRSPPAQWKCTQEESCWEHFSRQWTRQLCCASSIELLGCTSPLVTLTLYQLCPTGVPLNTLLLQIAIDNFDTLILMKTLMHSCWNPYTSFSISFYKRSDINAIQFNGSCLNHFLISVTKSSILNMALKETSPLKPKIIGFGPVLPSTLTGWKIVQCLHNLSKVGKYSG